MKKSAENTKKTDFKSYIDMRLQQDGYDAFKIPFSVDITSALITSLRPLWIGLGKMEAHYWEETLNDMKVSTPVYVTGLARSGTTIILNKLHGTKQFASHLYTDYPFIDMPLIWHKWLSISHTQKAVKAERTHLDRIKVSVDSPEALEEMIWAGFFEHVHNPQHSHVIRGGESHPDFENYYKTHICKIMHLRGHDRYLAKGNYNFTRIAYILRLFPDAKFIIPIREPESNIASLMKQHYLLSKAQQKHKSGLRYMQRIGHYEFGLDRRPVNVGNQDVTDTIISHWQNGNEIKGWALYYKDLHDWLYNLLQQNSAAKNAIMIVPYAALCNESENVMKNIAAFLDIEFTDSFATNLSAPTYYETGFTAEDKARIKDICLPSYESLCTLSTS